MGSWGEAAAHLHDLCWYAEEAQNLVLSRKEDLVDDDTWQSFLGKVKFMAKRLPSHLAPRLDAKHLRITNTATRYTIHGESTNSNAGRGGTYRRVTIDEAAFVPRSMTVFAAVRDACPGGLGLVSTPNGRDNVVGWVRFHQTPPQAGFNLITLPWSFNPTRDQAWYDRKKATTPRNEFAREIDISYEESVSGKVYEFDSQRQLRAVAYDPAYPVYRGYDFGTGAPTAVVWYQKKPDGSAFLDALEMTSSSDEDIVHAIMCRHIDPDDPPPGMGRNEVALGWGLREVADDHGDPAGRNRQSDLSSWFSRLRDLSRRWVERYGVGTPIDLNTRHLLSLSERVKLGQRVIRDVYVHPTRAVTVYDAIANRVFPTDDQGRVTKDIPVEDWTKHTCDAFEHIFANVYPINDARIEQVRTKRAPGRKRLAHRVPARF
jgi:hypothetical protein